MNTAANHSIQINRRAESALLILVGSLAIALLAQFSVHLPITPVPITGQTLAVFLVAWALGARRGIAAVVLYLLEGICGLPVFAAGATYVTAGYLLGFIVAAGLVGLASDLRWDRSWGLTLITLAGAQLVIYLLGALWLASVFGSSHVLALGVIPFLPGDAVKIAIAAIALRATHGTPRTNEAG